MKQKTYFTIGFLALCFLLTGCKSQTVRSQATEDGEQRSKAFFVGDLALPTQLGNIEVMSVSLATNLAGTGSDPPESSWRTLLLREMASQNVESPNKILASLSTSLVITKGELVPGVQKGDRFDIEVTLPSDSETSSLRGGFVLQSPMREMYVMDRIREGDKKATCAGPILVEPKMNTERDKVTQRRGKILGGGVSLIARPVGLRIVSQAAKPDPYQTMRIESAVNRRFVITTASGSKEKVAKAKDDKYLQLRVPPKYKNHLVRYLEVVRCVPLLETESQRLQRLATLQLRLLDSTTAKRAAMELEAIGHPAIETLKSGLTSPDVAVRFYAAEALAYLDESEAAQILGEVALTEHAFRGSALLALCALDDLYAYEELRKLMNAPTAETRYGAFWALRKMRPEDPLVKGEMLGDGTFYLCTIPSEGKPMLHVRKTERAEIVLFGAGQCFNAPLVVEGANNIVVRALNDQEMSISRFVVNRPDQRRVVSMKVEDVIHALSDVGATYPDVIEILQAAIEQNALETNFRIDALPAARREKLQEKTEESPPEEVDSPTGKG